MSTDATNKEFLCSYCEQPIKFRSDLEGKRTQCPKCKKNVWLFENKTGSIIEKLTSTWFYERANLFGLFGNRMVGPISDSELVNLLDSGQIDREFLVQSPQLTKNQPVQVGSLNSAYIREMCSQRIAEGQRIRNVKLRENQRDAKNRETLLQGVKKAIADGNVSLNERSQLFSFAAKAGIHESELEAMLEREAGSLLNQLIEDALADGIFDDNENEQISRMAIGLGVSLKLSPDQEFRLSLAQTAWALIQKVREGQLPKSAEFSEAEVFEVVSLKRPAGIPVGDNHYLKSTGLGTVKIDDKNLLIDGRLAAKKFAISSIVSVEWFRDGLFLKRSSGKSLFIRPIKFGFAWHQFAMTMEVLFTGEPVVGMLPDENFVPENDIVIAEVVRENNTTERDYSDSLEDDAGWSPSVHVPRFTFRVVGEAYENRFQYLSKLQIGEEVLLKREPGNPHDSNAIAVTNRERKVLGYLKREVSEWFAPILDKGRRYRCEVKVRTATGGIVIALYE